MISVVLTFCLFSFIGLLIQRNNVFKMLMCYENTVIGIILLMQIAATTELNDITVLTFTLVLIGLSAAESVIGICLLVQSINTQLSLDPGNAL